MLKATIHSEDIISFHIYAPKNIATIFMHQSSTHKRQRAEPIIIVDINAPL